LKKLAHLTHYDLLEVGVEATLQQVEESFRRMMDAFDRDSPAIYSLFSEDERRDVVERVREAYRILSNSKNRRDYNRWLVEQGILSHLPRVLPDREARPPSVVPGGPLDGETEITPPPTESDLFANEGPLSGAAFRRMRQERGLTLDELAGILRISRAYLEAIEDDEYHNLPPEVYLRGFVRAYARALRLDEEIWSGGYLMGYRRWREGQMTA
jgi:curved DNA-binding protein CbpA